MGVKGWWGYKLLWGSWSSGGQGVGVKMGKGVVGV